jgi:uncharacterized membrane protein
MSAGKLGTSTTWGLIAFLSVGVGGYAMFLVATGFKYVPPVVLQNGFPSPLGIEVHITAAAIALLMGPFQFLKVLRTKLPAVHRWMGRIYVTACIVGGIAGGSIALFSTSGLPAGLGFLSLAILWVPFTLMAWISAMRKDFTAHERWMIRSFALTFAAVTLRIYLPIAVIEAKGQFPVPAYQLIAWASWVPNLVIAELWIASRRKPRRRMVAEVSA